MAIVHLTIFVASDFKCGFAQKYNIFIEIFMDDVLVFQLFQSTEQIPHDNNNLLKIQLVIPEKRTQSSWWVVLILENRIIFSVEKIIETSLKAKIASNFISYHYLSINCLSKRPIAEYQSFRMYFQHIRLSTLFIQSFEGMLVPWQGPFKLKALFSQFLILR